MPDPSDARMEKLNREIVRCERCPRLRQWCTDVAAAKRRAFADWDYWGKPVPNFGAADARILIVGLAPAAHGGNRTGRMFTGDESGNWLYRALFEAGLASQAESTHRGDGLELRDTLITAAVHCAPPDNKPAPEEFRNCREWLRETIAGATEWRVLVTLGQIAYRETVKAFRETGLPQMPPLTGFGHGREHTLDDGRTVLCCYHPSQRNTYTGLVTHEMLRGIFLRARTLADT